MRRTGRHERLKLQRATVCRSLASKYHLSLEIAVDAISAGGARDKLQAHHDGRNLVDSFNGL